MEFWVPVFFEGVWSTFGTPSQVAFCAIQVFIHIGWFASLGVPAVHKLSGF